MTSRRIFGFCTWAVLVGCLSLALDRLHYAVSFTTPWQFGTSGTEEEDLFPIWKFAQGQTVYNDPTQIPFALSYYNWLFYDLYGAVAAFFLHLLHLGDIWLPTIARLLTLFFSLAAAAFSFAILRQNGALRDFCPAYLLAALSLITTFNPLFGFWVMTARPDVGSLALELAGFFFLVIYLRRPRLIFPLLAGLAFYLAWSLKQSAVTGFAAATLTLLLHRRSAALALMLLVCLAPIALTIFLGGADYRFSTLVVQTECPSHFGNGLKLFCSSIAKMPFIALALLVLFTDTFRLDRFRKLAAVPPEETLFLLATLIALLFGLATAGKSGAAENYFFPLSVWSGLWLFWVLPRLGRRYFIAACLGVTALILGGITLVFLGRAGVIDLRDQHQPHMMLVQKLHELPPPVFVAEVYGNLPWIQPNPPNFVVSSLYSAEESAGAIPRSRGLEALMDRGYFGTIVTFCNENPGDAVLARYKLADHDSTFNYYVRK